MPKTRRLQHVKMAKNQYPSQMTRRMMTSQSMDVKKMTGSNQLHAQMVRLSIRIMELA